MPDGVSVCSEEKYENVVSRFASNIGSNALIHRSGADVLTDWELKNEGLLKHPYLAPLFHAFTEETHPVHSEFTY